MKNTFFRISFGLICFVLLISSAFAELMTKHTVDSSFDGAYSVFAADVDSDGKIGLEELIYVMHEASGLR